MQPQDHIGRIHQDAFVISTAVLLGLAILAVAVRFTIRFRVQRQSAFIDDGFILLALAFLLINVTVLYREVLDRMYHKVALQDRIPDVIPVPDFLQISYQFHKWVTICNMSGWCVVMAVKFSFMFFFRRLINQLPTFNTFWWVLMVYNVGCLGYGIAAYYIGCPFYSSPKELQCTSGTYRKRLIDHSIAQMILDLIGDMMILAMPVVIIWHIRVHWQQKVALMFSLCLTIFMIAATVARVSGLVFHGGVDDIWGTYWTTIAAEIAVFMASATAFRTFFVARTNSKTNGNGQGAKYFFSNSFVARFRRKKVDSFGDTVDSSDGKGRSGLPGIPRAYITGLRTFIDGQRRTKLMSVEKASDVAESDGHTLRRNEGN